MTRPADNNFNYAHYKGGKDLKSKNLKLRQKRLNPSERMMIAWDGEGITFDTNKPQSYVLFGCSAAPEDPLVIESPDDDLDVIRIINYACDIADLYPDAFHVGYFFTYDQNMIIKSLNPMQKVRLNETNAIRLKRGDIKYRIQVTPTKRIRLTRETPRHKSSLVIDDMASYFGTSFIKAYAGLFPDYVDTPEFAKVIDGKNARALTTWEDMPEIQSYWRTEIEMMRQMAERFREIMYDAGFLLHEWYGPGALANLIRRERKLSIHEWGGKEENMPPAVALASQKAYFGGHVEQYQIGYAKGPIYAYDINSAYPAGFAQAVSLREGGMWKHVTTPTPGLRFGVYRLRYREQFEMMPTPWMPQPLPHRDRRSNTSYPPVVDGWYWTPEASHACQMYGAQVIEGWEWWPADPTERPWEFFGEMYDTRLRLKRANSPMEWAFKLGLNSMYGKMAQRAGWDKDTKTPPKAHTLPLAGYVTSYCRAMIMELLKAMPPESIIAVETDGIFSTCPPEQLDITIDSAMGNWSVKQWDEILYLQTGLYAYKTGDAWKTKTRGFSAQFITPELLINYMQSLMPNEQWDSLRIPQGNRFIGLGSAVARSVNMRNAQVNPFKMQSMHCRWYPNERDMTPGSKGKRFHISKYCPACHNGQSASMGMHRLVVRSEALLHPESQPYRLPWQKDYEEPQWAEMESQMKSEISAAQAGNAGEHSTSGADTP